MEFDDSGTEFDHEGYDDSFDDVVEDIPSPEEVAAFWNDSRTDGPLPF